MRKRKNASPHPSQMGKKDAVRFNQPRKRHVENKEKRDNKKRDQDHERRQIIKIVFERPGKRHPKKSTAVSRYRLAYQFIRRKVQVEYRIKRKEKKNETNKMREFVVIFPFFFNEIANHNQYYR